MMFLLSMVLLVAGAHADSPMQRLMKRIARAEDGAADAIHGVSVRRQLAGSVRRRLPGNRCPPPPILDRRGRGVPAPMPTKRPIGKKTKSVKRTKRPSKHHESCQQCIAHTEYECICDGKKSGFPGWYDANRYGPRENHDEKGRVNSRVGGGIKIHGAKRFATWQEADLWMKAHKCGGYSCTEETFPHCSMYKKSMKQESKSSPPSMDFTEALAAADKALSAADEQKRCAELFPNLKKTVTSHTDFHGEGCQKALGRSSVNVERIRARARSGKSASIGLRNRRRNAYKHSE